MERRTLLIGFCLLSLALTENAAAQLPSISSLSNPLLGQLTKSLGVTPDQAEGGVGSMLTLAQEKLVAGDFDKIAAVIPGASKYMEKAKSLGAVTGPIGNAVGLNSSLGKLGISPSTAAKFVPQVTKYVGKVGGKDVGALLGNALK